MILTATQLDEKTDPLYASEPAAAASRHDSQVFYANMPSPVLAPAQTGVEGMMARVSLTGDAPPAYEEVHNDVLASSTDHAPARVGDEKSRIPEDDAENHGSGSSAARNSTGYATRFTPLVLHSKGGTLQEGFHRMLPPTDVSPHPFVSRDVKEGEWTEYVLH